MVFNLYILYIQGFDNNHQALVVPLVCFSSHVVTRKVFMHTFLIAVRKIFSYAWAAFFSTGILVFPVKSCLWTNIAYNTPHTCVSCLFMFQHHAVD